MAYTVNEPFLSIIIPVYEVEKYIERCLLSCMQQTLYNVEIIVIDDCGADNSIKIAKKLKAEDNRIKIISNEFNKGAFLSRKAGVEAACGKYVVFLDPDDELNKNAVEDLCLGVSEFAADIVFFGVEIRPNRKFFPLKNKTPCGTCKTRNRVMETIFCNSTGASFGTPGKMYLKKIALKAFEKARIVKCRIEYAEDVFFLFLASSFASSCISIEKKLYVYYLNEGSITQNKGQQRLLKNSSQIDTIVKCILELSKDEEIKMLNEPHLMNAVNNIVNRLESDKYLVLRHASDTVSGKSLYVDSVISSYRINPRVKELMRLILYFLSFAKLKL